MEEKARDKAIQQVKAQVKASKSEVMMPIVKKLGDYFREIQNDDTFLFNGWNNEHVRLFRTVGVDYHVNSMIMQCQEHAYVRQSIGVSNTTKYIHVRITDDFIVSITLGNNVSTNSSDEVFYDVDEAIKHITRHLLKYVIK
jgi:hypothetical protein